MACGRALGEAGAALLPDPCTILTHCNAGGLATGGYGTALGVVYAAQAAGRQVRVFADETRPLLQGARLTAWELATRGIAVTLLCDGAAGGLLRSGRIDVVIVGADRIARNGDTANKVGTYPLAVLAREHGVPFYVAAPASTFDPTATDGAAIVVEERAPDEVLSLGRGEARSGRRDRLEPRLRRDAGPAGHGVRHRKGSFAPPIPRNPRGADSRCRSLTGAFRFANLGRSRLPPTRLFSYRASR